VASLSAHLYIRDIQSVQWKECGGSLFTVIGLSCQAEHVIRDDYNLLYWPIIGRITQLFLKGVLELVCSCRLSRAWIAGNRDKRHER